MSSVAEDFYKDIKRKKSIGSSIHKRKGKRGYVGKMLTTVDLLQGKDKREYTKPGKVVKWNMYKQLIPMEELKEYTEDQQKRIMEKWREVHTNSEIIHHLGVDKNVFYNLLHELGVLSSDKTKGKPHSRSKKIGASQDDLLSFEELKSKPQEEQYRILKGYRDRYTDASIAKAWGRKTSAVHNKMYNLKKYMESHNLELEKQEEKQEEEPKEVAITARENASPEPLEKEENQVTEEKENPMVALKELMDTVKDKIQTGNTPEPVEEPKETEEPEEIKETEQDDQIKKKSSSMNFSFESEKEGFILHQDLERFISVLKKNPDTFKVNISITRTEDENE